MKPVRIQLSRKKGFKLKSPNGLPIVKVDRTTRFGNPFKMLGGPSHPGYLSRDESVRLFRIWMTKPGHFGHDELAAIVRRDLRGKNLACWCRIWDEKGLRVPCHADVLLELANA